MIRPFILSWPAVSVPEAVMSPVTSKATVGAVVLLMPTKPPPGLSSSGWLPET